MKIYKNKTLLIILIFFGITGIGYKLWHDHRTKVTKQTDVLTEKSERKYDSRKLSKPKEEEATPTLNPVSEDSLAGKSMDEKVDALVAYYEKHGFTAATSLLGAFHGDQEVYQATKLLAILASQKEPKAVFEYLAGNDAFLLSDPDVMASIMGSPPELFPIEEASKYASMIPPGGSRFQVYNYLSQIMAFPANIHKIDGILSSVKDPGVLSYLERSLPRSLLASLKISDAIQQIEKLNQYGEFTNRNDFVKAGEALAMKHDYSMDGLAELEALSSDKSPAMLQGYIEGLIANGKLSFDLLDYTYKRYVDSEDDGSLLALVFKRTLAADPEETISRLKKAGIQTNELDAMITRNFSNLTQNHPSVALDYIDQQKDTQIKDNLLATYGLALKDERMKDIREIDSQISDPRVKSSYILDATVQNNTKEPKEIYDFIMKYDSSEIKQDLISVNLLSIAAYDMDLAINMTQAQTDPERRAASLYSLLNVAGNNNEQREKVMIPLNQIKNIKAGKQSNLPPNN